MSATLKWKSRLLSSSVPLEYEVARTLTEHQFAVDADYAYSRMDGDSSKDFSVDISATAYPPYRGEKILAEIHLLIECKHRHENTKWLFFPDPNTDEFATFRLGSTVRAVDEFSSTFFRSMATAKFDELGTVCLKGVEIDLSTGSVHDSEIRHGLYQLQFALPRLLSEAVTFNLRNLAEDRHPFFFCPILLTTASIHVAKAETSVRSVEAATALEDISAEEPFVLLHLDSTPEFEDHRARACERLSALAEEPFVLELDEIRKAGGAHHFELPSTKCANLADKNGGKFMEYFSQVVICQQSYLPTLISRIKDASGNAIRTRRRPRARVPRAQA